MTSTHSALVLFQALCIAFLCAGTALADDVPVSSADSSVFVFIGGTVITVDPANPQAEALAIAGEEIIAVGDLESVGNAARDEAKRRGEKPPTLISVKGRTVMPGFVEPHTHVIQTAFDIDTHLMVNLSSFTVPMDPGTIPQIQEKLKSALPNVPKDGWLLGWGVDPSRATPFMASLDAKTLDAVSTRVPIFVLNQSGHIAYVNTRAIELAEISGHTPNPEGGVYVRKCNADKTECTLTGELQESPAYGVFRNKFFTPSLQTSTDDRMPGALAQTYRRFAEAGVTTATDLGLGTVTGSIDKELDLLRAMAKDQKTPLRIRAYLDAHFLKGRERTFRPSGASADRLGIIGIKFFADGSTQGLTAALKTPYDWPPGTSNRGQLNYPDEDDNGKVTKDGENQLFNEAKIYLDQGWQLAIHANGDRATQQVLNVYGRLKDASRAKRDPGTLRCRIEHLTVTEDKQLDTIRDLGLTPSMTIGHPYFWGYAFGATKAESGHNPILGSPRAQRIDPAKSLLERNVRFSFNSDAPISPVAPLRYISTAVTRRWQDGPEQKAGVLGGQQISIKDAIRAVTLDAAYQLFLDEYVGSLKVGKLADLVILDQNPLEMEDRPQDIMNIKVVATYLSGVCVSGNCPRPLPLGSAPSP